MKETYDVILHSAAWSNGKMIHAEKLQSFKLVALGILEGVMSQFYSLPNIKFWSKKD